MIWVGLKAGSGETLPGWSPCNRDSPVSGMSRMPIETDCETEFDLRLTELRVGLYQTIVMDAGKEDEE